VRAVLGSGAGGGARLAGIALVVLLHIAIVYVLVTALARRPAESLIVPIATRLIEEAKPERVEPPPPPPRFAPPPPPFVPPPEVHIETPPPPSQSTAIQAVTPVKPVEAPPPREPVTVQPRVDAAKSREPEYPPASRRMGEQGSLVLQVLIDEQGRAAQSKLVQSSGFDRLDQAALAGIKDNYRFVPGTVDGKPQAMWFTFKFTWKLR
jgi:protein TonB